MESFVKFMEAIIIELLKIYTHVVIIT